MNYLEYTVGKLMVDSFERGIVKYLDKQSSANRFGGTIVLKSKAEPIAVLVKNTSNRVYRYASSLALVMELPLYKLVGEELHKQEVVL